MVAGENVVVTSSSLGASRETGEPYHDGNSGGASVWWSWSALFSGFVTMTTAGSSFDTVLGVYTGSSVASLTRVASDDDENYGAGIYTSKATRLRATGDGDGLTRRVFRCLRAAATGKKSRKA